MSTQSKATSLSRGMDLRRGHGDALLDWYTENSIIKPRRGLFGKKLTPEMMLTWTAVSSVIFIYWPRIDRLSALIALSVQETISRPMLKIDDKVLKKESLETFKLIQMYMGDRKAKQLSHFTALSLAIKGWSHSNLRDEIFLQLIRQTTDNPKE